jgi:RHS repeat-associated protein
VGNFSGHTDGRVDLVARVQQTGGVYVSSVFDPTATYTVSSFPPQVLWGQWPTQFTWQVVVGDFSGDGKDDLAALAVQSGALYVAASTGSGFNGQQYWQTWSTAATWVDMLAGDFTGHTNGQVDLVARVQQTGGVYVSKDFNPLNDYTQHPDSQYLWAVWNTQTTTWALTSVGDFNGDGRADVATWDADPNSAQWGNWYVWLSSGSSFQAPAGPAVVWGGLGNWQGVGAGAFVRRGVTVTYAYDIADRLTGITQSSSPAGSVLASYAYGYDPGNRLTQETVNGVTVTYGYDAADELTQSGAASYGYDGAGNRTNTGYATGPGNQLLSDGTWLSYTYDGEGNLTKKSKGASAETWTYGYNLRNQMVWAQDRSMDGGTLLSAATYVYDVLGNRIEVDSWTSSSGMTTVTRSGYDGAYAWADLNGSNAPVMRRVFLDGPNQLAARVDASGNAAWYLSDHLGSVRQVVGYGGTVVLDQLAYDGYGKITSESSAAAGDAYKYAGGRYDAITGYTLFAAGGVGRYYDAATGRWTSQDPLGLFAGVNLYDYVRNDPTNATDPSGLLEGLMGILLEKAAEKGIDATMARAAAMVEAHPVSVLTVLATYGVALSHEMGHNPNSRAYMGTAAGWQFYINTFRPDLAEAWKYEKPKRAPDVTELVSTAKRLGIDAEAIAGRKMIYATGRDPDDFVRQELRAAIKKRLAQLSLVKFAKYQGVKDAEIKGAKSEEEVWQLALRRWAKNEGATNVEVQRAELTNTLPALIADKRARKQPAACDQGQPKPKPQPDLIPVDIGKKVLTKEEEDALKKACFAAGTKLLTPNGFKEIERLRPGDLVLSRPESDVGGPVLPKVIEEAFVTTGQILHLHVGERVIRTTPEHPFWVYNKGWVSAGQLRIGDLLVSHDEKVLTLTDIHLTEGIETVYNMRVAEFSTYFVGCDEWGFSVWAHNECFYRAMSEKEHAAVIPAQKLSRREQGSSNLGVTQNRAYAESLVDRRNGGRKYPRVVEIETKDGTALALTAMGAAHNSAALLFPDNPAWSDGFPVQLKVEQGAVISYLLHNDAGVAFFNSTIISIRTIR